jgi:hypothetical protein
MFMAACYQRRKTKSVPENGQKQKWMNFVGVSVSKRKISAFVAAVIAADENRPVTRRKRSGTIWRMYFEHLVALQDEAPLASARLSWEDAWRGLWQRVEKPQLFLPGLAGCVILARGDRWLTRRLDFGSASIFDRVSYAEGQWLRFDVEASAEHAGGALMIALEEGEAGQLFLRFSYQTTLDVQGPEARYAEYAESAYRESDLETARIIRLLASDKK